MALTFEERLRPIALAELCQLLKARAEDIEADELARIAEEVELEAGVQDALQAENQETFGGWA